MTPLGCLVVMSQSVVMPNDGGIYPYVIYAQKWTMDASAETISRPVEEFYRSSGSMLIFRKGKWRKKFHLLL